LSSLFLEVGVAAQACVEGGEQRLAFLWGDPPGAHGIFGGTPELFQQLLRLVLHVAQDDGDAVSVDLAYEIETAVGVDEELAGEQEVAANDSSRATLPMELQLGGAEGKEGKGGV
jgi:hypothetical protein